jgi:hypothetical protein
VHICVFLNARIACTFEYFCTHTSLAHSLDICTRAERAHWYPFGARTQAAVFCTAACTQPNLTACFFGPLQVLGEQSGARTFSRFLCACTFLSFSPACAQLKCMTLQAIGERSDASTVYQHKQTCYLQAFQVQSHTADADQIERNVLLE